MLECDAAGRVGYLDCVVEREEIIPAVSAPLSRADVSWYGLGAVPIGVGATAASAGAGRPHRCGPPVSGSTARMKGVSGSITVGWQVNARLLAFALGSPAEDERTGTCGEYGAWASLHFRGSCSTKPDLHGRRGPRYHDKTHPQGSDGGILALVRAAPAAAACRRLCDGMSAVPAAARQTTLEEVFSVLAPR